jgi:hypothetical protein
VANWGWDPLSLAASAASYAESGDRLGGAIEFEFYVDRHPCDDEAYMADLFFATSVHPLGIDGPGDG